MFRKCEGCGCSLDPGEGRLCDECMMKNERNRARKAAMEAMLAWNTQPGFRQMEMEELLHG